jgi:hypothetical protein
MPDMPPIEVFTACAPRDFATLRWTVAGLRRWLPVGEIIVATAGAELPALCQIIGREATVLAEDHLVPGWTLAALRAEPVPEFPRGAGWYFQQFLKLAHGLREGPEYYLVWDADTVPLRSFPLFASAGCPWFTIAEEYHHPYFATYQNLFGEAAQREFSFIAQHIVIHRPTLREMLREIEVRSGGDWVRAILRSLGGESPNRFSEYETYGHYVKARHPHQAAYRQLAWTREGTRLAGARPTAQALARLGERFDFVAFESSHRWARRWWRRLRAAFSG